jgi:hypothetical protein
VRKKKKINHSEGKLVLTLQDIKDVEEKGKLIGEGEYGKVYKYGKHLFKVITRSLSR